MRDGAANCLLTGRHVVSADTPVFRWIQRQDIGPPPRSGLGMAFDPARGVAVLFGGQSRTALFGDTWEWDGVFLSTVTYFPMANVM
ncbi:hypothetical protein GCM10022403_048300 [Streptomyces coacervatus]|uniref:Uncharacterized protein n=1 Tax=Streptomyces coacervatus TaxID=647381 RepID=A0ABP7I315_9ACTN